MNRKGFTLLELLAVIVILSILALIAVPQIINMLGKSKQKAAEISASNYLKAVDDYISLSEIKSLSESVELKGNTDYQVSRETYKTLFSNSNSDNIYLNEILDINGSVPSKGIVSLDENREISSSILIFDDVLVICNKTICSSDMKEAQKKEQINVLYDSNESQNYENLEFPSYDFVQPWLFNEYNKEDMKLYINKLKRAGYEGIIFQYSMEFNINSSYGVEIKSAWYNSSLITNPLNLDLYRENVLENLLEVASDNNFKIYIGLPNSDDWFNNRFVDSNWQNAVANFYSSVIDEIYTKYNSYSAFNGWYLPFEMYSNNDNYYSYWANMLNNYIQKISSLNDNRSIMISPFVSNIYNHNYQEVKEQWISFLNSVNFRENDIINMQDSVSNTNKEIAELYEHIKGVKDAIDNSNKNISFWLNLECFNNNNKTDSNTLKRLFYQISLSNIYTKNLSTFSYSHYLISDENDGLYREYYSKINDSNSIISVPHNGYVYEDINGAEAPIPSGFTVDSTNNVIANGLVIIDSSGNEFVWIPINGGIRESCYSYQNDEFKTVHYSRYISNNVTCSSGINDTLPNNVVSDETQISKYGGFYVGRYESSYNYNNGNPRPVIKKSTNASSTFSYEYVTSSSYDGYLWNNINYENAKQYATNMASLYNYDESIKTGLINGKEWDSMLRWFEIDDSTNAIYDSRKWGNYSDSISPATNGNYESGILKPSGSNENWKMKNIYDIAGNLGEWTSEIVSSQAVIRSNGYNDNGMYGSASYGFASASYSFPNIGFRVVLYID